MLSSEDKFEVSKDKHEDWRKMEYFREAINSTRGRKGKSKPPHIRTSMLKRQRGNSFHS